MSNDDLLDQLSQRLPSKLMDRVSAALAAHQQVGVQIGFVSQDTLDRIPLEGTGRIDFKARPDSGCTIPVYLAAR